MIISKEMDLEDLGYEMGNSPSEKETRFMRSVLNQKFAGRDTEELSGDEWKDALKDASRHALYHDTSRMVMT